MLLPAMARSPGRKPDPDVVHWLKTPGADRPDPADDKLLGVPPCPRDLEPGSREQALWDELSEALLRARVLTTTDGLALLHLVEAQQRYETFRDMVGTKWLVLTPNGYPIQNPVIALMNTAQKQVVALLTEFGITPSSRTRVARGGTAGDGGALPAPGTGDLFDAG